MSKSLHLVDPELRSLLEDTPQVDITEDMLPTIRSQPLQFAPPPPDVIAAVGIETRNIAGSDGISVTIYRPVAGTHSRGCIFHVHGGGYITGSASMMEPLLRPMAQTLDCVIVAVHYRLAPETRFPGAVEDCYAALAWLFGHADDLGVDPDRIGVMGESAGGGLAAALALMTRDRLEYRLAYQHLIYPMIDDRTCARDPHPYAGEFVWTAGSNRFGWQALLGHEPGIAGVSPYAAAAREENLAGLPPAFISTGALDLFVDENLLYAQRLVHAGVPTELHLYPGAIHGFDMLLEDNAVSRRARADSLDALRRAMAAT